MSYNSKKSAPKSAINQPKQVLHDQILSNVSSMPATDNQNPTKHKFFTPKDSVYTIKRGSTTVTAADGIVNLSTSVDVENL